MQRDFIEKGGFGDSLGNDVARLEAIIPATARLIALFRAAALADRPHARGAQARSQRLPAVARSGAAIRACISARSAPWAGCWCAGEPGNQIVDACSRSRARSSSTSPARACSGRRACTRRCKGMGITHLVFAGVTTEVCVQTSMREANDRGYECLLIEEATESYFPQFKAATIEMIVGAGRHCRLGRHARRSGGGARRGDRRCLRRPLGRAQPGQGRGPPRGSGRSWKRRASRSGRPGA